MSEHKKMSEHKRSRQEVCDALSEISSVNSDRPRRHWQSGSCRGLRDLIASFGQNIITVLSETTHVEVKFDRDQWIRDET